MTFTPTPEQAAIVEAARRTKDNILVSALAGATKTSTLVLVSNAVLVPTLALAFNKRIAEEMGKRLPGHVQSATINSIGHRAWGSALNKKLVVDPGKLYNDLKEYSDSRPQREKKLLSENFAALIRAVNNAKSLGYVPQKARTMGKTLCNEEEFVSTLYHSVPDADINDFFLSTIDELLLRSIAQAYNGLIDFNDQIYMSTLFSGNFTKYPLVLTDEVQDLSPLNFETLTKLIGQRLIAVGDQNQAIYGFRGAHTSAMSVMKEKFSMIEMPLTISMRCPIKVVEFVQHRVPTMRYSDWAKLGKVERLTSLNPVTDILDGSAIICRNNAPLFACAMRLIRAGRGVHLIGNDIGAGLVKLMKKIAPSVLEKEEFLKAIRIWHSSEIDKQPEPRHALIHDKFACLNVFAEVGKDSNEAMLWAENLFKQAGPIQMMTGHKSKGLEFDTVYHLEPGLIPSKWARRAAEEGDDTQLQQEYNLQYVIHTRAKENLYMIDLEDIDE